ncbi:hypothetical protein BU16DRAFT_543852 [Lophium mytilinum]|uniref:Transcription factor TFIIIB component B'' Myb domain-containing protein n=1 Tax=Lophium mytilinum TaxID=390894 RepID=A0A6A6QES5_9PEZI|nr:hypothetical protein BU16DRAFT_543852 [Lophium mytilinum]
MSSDAGASQANATSEKPHAPLPVSTFGSSLINKSTRKFAPKAIQRRRPPAPPAPEPSQAPPDSSAAPTVDAPTPQPSTQAEPEPADSQHATSETQPPTTALPQKPIETPAQAIVTPAQAATTSTQSTATSTNTEAPIDPQTHLTTNTVQSGSAAPSTHTTASDARQEQRSGAGEPGKSPVPAPAEAEEQDDDGAVSPRPSKRQRLSQEPPRDRTSKAPDQSQAPETTTLADSQATSNTPALSPLLNQEATPVTITTTTTTTIPTFSQTAENRPLPTPSPSAVTTPRSGEPAPPSQAETSAAPSPSPDTPQSETAGPPSPPTETTEQTAGSKKRRRAPGTQPKATAKPRGKRKAKEGPAREDGEAEHPGPATKKPRKVRKDKGTKRKAPGTEENGATDDPRPKPKRVRKKRTATAETEGQGEAGNEDGQEPRQRGRRTRAPTPDDAEDYEVAPDTTMASLAVADTRRGKLSTREKQMREIDWDEVKKRRAERALQLAQNGGANSTEVDERLDQAANERNAANDVPQFTTDADGNIVLNSDSLIRDRRAEAAEDEDILEAIEEDDLTNRFNMGSHLLANRRDPAERIRGPSKKWTITDTNEFYDALTIFGTDFGMVATLFPNKNRRCIKHKFVREERLDPDRIKEALVGRKEPIDFNEYLKRTGKDASAFKDPRQLEAELKEIEEQNQAEVDIARKEYAEIQRQKQLAGADVSGDEGGEGEENGGKKKRERQKKKPKGQPVGGEELEIVEELDD